MIPLLLLAAASLAAQILGNTPPILGPFVGTLGPREASVFARVSREAQGEDTVRLSLLDAQGRVVQESGQPRSAERDFVVRWDVSGLLPDTPYAFAVSTRRTFFRTPSEPEKPARITLALGSCANDRPGLPNPVWPAIRRCAPDALVLIGDSPYIDSTDLATQRRRYAEFYANPDLSALLQSTSFYATWDDHDFAFDGADGTAKGKDASRRAFLEYHANPGAGEGNQGIYMHFRRGAADVFLLDTRWFSGTEKSFADPEKKSLLGAKQWEWLQRELPLSTAPFKLLACGMVWNEAAAPGKTGKPDHWMAYSHERAALFRLIQEKKIGGVILVGGDLHRSRAFLHPKSETGVAYPLHEWITSPLGDDVMTESDAAAKPPSLTFDRGEPHAFLLVDVDSTKAPPTIAARFLNARGEELYRIAASADELRP